MTTAVEKRNQDLAKTGWDLLNGMKRSISGVLPKHLTPERMVMIAFTAMRQNPKLMQCSRESIIGSIMTASILGLEPSGPLGHGALIPYKGECQFQPMYQGLLELARRSGLIKDVQLRAVYKGDHYKYRFGLDPTIEHEPLEGEGAADPSRECTHVYCIIRFTNGGVQWDQASFNETIAHAKRFSKTWDRELQKFKDDSPWAEHPVAMSLKTILKRTLKLCPKSPEMSLAMQIDDLGETGKMATLKQAEDGVFDVDFGGSDPEPEPEKPKSTLDRLVEQNGKKPESAAATTQPSQSGQGDRQIQTPSGNTAGVSTPSPSAADTPTMQTATKGSGWVDPESKCTPEQFDELQALANDKDVPPKVFISWVKEVLKLKMVAHLPQKHFARAKAFLENGGKE